MDELGGQRVRMVHRDDDEDGRFSVVGDPVLVTGCSIQPERGSESYDAGQTSRQGWRVFGPPALAALRSWDAVDLEQGEPGSGDWLRVPLYGAPALWPDEDGRPHHVELTATLTRG